jgi:hypothetical protein
MTAAEQVQSWFEAYLAAPIVITMFLAFKIIKKTRFRRLLEIDIDSGKRELDLPAILAEERGGAGKVANVEEDLEDGLLDILPLRRRETPGISLSESIATSAGRLGWD